MKPEQVQQAHTLLKQLTLFKECSDEHFRLLSECLEARDFAKGKVIIMEQEISRTLYLLVKGSVGIWRREKGEKRLLATLRAPDFFGEMSMFTEAQLHYLEMFILFQKRTMLSGQPGQHQVYQR